MAAEAPIALREALLVSVVTQSRVHLPRCWFDSAAVILSPFTQLLTRACSHRFLLPFGVPWQYVGVGKRSTCFFAVAEHRCESAVHIVHKCHHGIG